MTMSRLLTVTALAAVMALGASQAHAADAGAWAERVQIIYDQAHNSVARKTVRVWDSEPEKNLEFTWEPAAGAAPEIAADGTVSGRGKLTWRIRGSASYDPKSVYSAYSGAMRDGRPDGKGRLEIRSGEVLEGSFRNGLLDGEGMRISADGSRYDGAFREGVQAGEGRLALRTGEIYVGPFAAGVRHGTGTTTLPGGTTYVSDWSMGRELGKRRDIVADATLGGLLKAQSDGGDAGKVEIGIAIDQRMNQESGVQYLAQVGDSDIQIFPQNEDMNAAWRGDGLVSSGDYYVTGVDWEANVPAFVEADLRTTDGSRVRLDTLELQVKDSIAYRKPMLTLQEHVGCVGFRPSLSIKNNGWGDAKNVSLSVKFSGEPAYETDAAGNTDVSAAMSVQSTETYTVKVPDFSDGADVMLDGALQEGGVDVQKLKDQRFSCASRDGLNVCRSQVFNTVGFGKIADYVWGQDKLYTTAIGAIDYDWSDDRGNAYHQSEPFRANIALTTIELPEEAAECGDGFGGAPDAPPFQDVNLPLNQSGYTVKMTLRGNRNLKDYKSRLKLYSDQTAYHEFAVAAKFADGSVRTSKPVVFFFFRPKPSTFTTKMEPAACYLEREVGGCG